MPELEPGLSVFVPALNEERYIGPMIEALATGLRATLPRFEILLVDDGSTDATGSIMDDLAARHPEVRVFHNPRCLGLGEGYRTALTNARFATITDLPGDDSYDLMSMREFWEATRTHETVIGCRMNQRAMRSPLRAVLSNLFTTCVNLLFNMDLRDIHGPVAVPVAEVRKAPLSYAGYVYSMEMLVYLLSGKRDIPHRPVRLKPDDRAKSRALRLQTVWSLSKVLLRLFWQVRLAPIIQRRA
ncbi:glycosyltransferase family 2 protein [Humidesulfovibrio sp.]